MRADRCVTMSETAPLAAGGNNTLRGILAFYLHFNQIVLHLNHAVLHLNHTVTLSLVRCVCTTKFTTKENIDVIEAKAQFNIVVSKFT